MYDDGGAVPSSNPVFRNNDAFTKGQQYARFDPAPGATTTAPYDPAQLDEMYKQPSATPAQTGRMTYDDVVMRAAMLFGVLLSVAAVTWWVVPDSMLMPVWLGSMFAGLGLGLFIAFSKTIRPPLMMLYAGIEGVFVAAISKFFEGFYDGIIVQAVLATMGAFVAMLIAYKIKAIRVTPKFTRILIIATMGYLAFQLIHFFAVMLGAPSMYSMGLLGVGISLFGVGLASLNLVLDFDFIDRGVAQGLPERYSWVAAYGLLVTLVWLYIEMLRLIAILRGDN